MSVYSFTRKVFHRLAASAATLLRGTHHDNATTTIENQRHWAPAKDLPPIQLNTPEARRKLRERARYEEDNNCYCAGIVSTLASDCVGYVAPTPQIQTGNIELDKFIETEWKQWSESAVVNLPEKLHVMDRARRTDGESFVLFTSDRGETLRTTGYYLNLTIIPQSRVCEPSYNYNDIQTVQFVDSNGETYKQDLINDDGVIVNSLTGQPHEFKVVNISDEVYGSGLGLIGSNFRTVSARYMKQWFRPKRPGQFRGICEIGAALGLFGQLRRFGMATLSAAEIAAMMTAILKTNLPAEGADAPTPLQPFSAREFERGMITAMPDGWDISQMKAEHPISTFEMFVNMILREIGRLLNMPFGIVAGDHSKYNYSSGRLDVIGYDEEKKFERKELCIRILNPLMWEFLSEVAFKRKEIRKLIESNSLKVQWQFTNRPSIAPDVDASVEDTRLKNGTITLSEIFTARGLDYREQMEQRAKEKQELSALGLDNTNNSDIINGIRANGQQTSI